MEVHDPDPSTGTGADGAPGDAATAAERAIADQALIDDVPDEAVVEPRPVRRRDPDQPALLDVRGLRTYFHTRSGVVQAVDGVDLSVQRGEVLGVVGESGCGKSVTALSIMGLVPYPGNVEEGTVNFDGVELTELSNRRMSTLRGDSLSMIFQQPSSALNPVHRAGRQIEEVYELHRDLDADERTARAVDMLRQVGIPDPERRANAYPHELSGGMAQRVMIAMALACEPDLLIADEPTTALDVTIQAQILDLMRDLVSESGTAVVLITHDLGVVAEMADRVAVMYAGQVVEEADVITLFEDPKHPYTRGLIGSMPVLGDRRDALDTIPGVVPNLVDPPDACRFADRCQARVDHDLAICTQQDPDLLPVVDTDADQHVVRCFLHHDAEGRPRSVEAGATTADVGPGGGSSASSADAGAGPSGTGAGEASS